MWQNINLRYKIAAIVALVVILLCIGFYTYTKVFTPDLPEKLDTIKATEPIDANIKAKTFVTQKAKENPDDPDLIVNQKYTAVVQGEKIEVPASASSATDGTTTTVSQEVDLSKVMEQIRKQLIENANQQLAEEKKKIIKQYDKDWEVSVGVGVHNSDTYIPIEVQRNYESNKAIAIEIHQDFPNAQKTEGGEIKHVWMF